MLNTLPDLLIGPKRRKSRSAASAESLFAPAAVVQSGSGGVDGEPQAAAAPPVCASCPVAHTGTRYGAHVDYSLEKAVFESAVGGAYGRVRVPSVGSAGGKGVTGKLRGKCRGFSRSSSVRLRALVHSVNREAVGAPTFVTLTYHEQYPDPVDAKKHLKRFKQRLQRLYPAVWGVWKLEPQERGAPHFHLLLFGVELELRVVVGIWHDIAGAGSDLHRRWHLGELGNRPCVEKTASWERVTSYCAKYFAKPFDDPAWECFGRGWGEVQRSVRSAFIQIDRVSGPAVAVPVFERALRRRRQAGGVGRAFIRAVVRNEDGSVEYKHCSVARIPDILNQADHRRAIGKPGGFWWSVLTSGVHVDYLADLSDAKQRKAFKRALMPKKQGGTCSITNVRFSLHFRKARSFSAPVKRVLADGSVHESRVQRPARSSLMPSSESRRLWDWACGEGVQRASGGRRHDHEQSDIEWWFDQAWESPLIGLRWLIAWNAASWKMSKKG